MFESCKNKSCILIGAVHVPALPGSDGYEFDMTRVIKKSVADALAYKEGGFDALIVENMHDVPYRCGSVAAETVAAMTVVAQAVKNAVNLPLGVQLLAGANIESLAVATALDLDFIRVEGFVFAHVGDEGLHQASAPTLVRKRAELKAQKVKIFADIKKKHSSHAITADVDLAETGHAAEFFKADAVIVSGLRTAAAPLESEVKAVAEAVKIPTLVGSGVTPQNIALFSKHAQALIIGSYAKKDGHWANDCDGKRLEALVKALDQNVPV